jgi:hypothetical protein
MNEAAAVRAEASKEAATSPVVLTSQASSPNARYIATVDARISEALSRTTSSAALFAEMRGAWPGLVAKRLPECTQVDMQYNSHKDADNITLYNPELHPLEFEWYFTNSTASWVAKEVLSKREATVCLGTPTVFVAAGLSDRINLIDSSTLILSRFGSAIEKRKLAVQDVAEAKSIASHSDCVIFDPPWYYEETLRWLVIASEVVRPGGRIVFSLFPPLVRPSAGAERERILALAAEIGAVDYGPNLLEYETPLFEHIALSRSGIGGIGNWRRGDLITINVKNKSPLSYHSLKWHRLVPDVWKTFIINQQVIKIKQIEEHKISEPAIRPVPGIPDFIYDSVSVRDPRRKDIGIWTSRNRVACVRDSVLIGQIVERVSAGEQLQQVIQDVCRDRTDKDIVLSAMTAVLHEP